MHSASPTVYHNVNLATLDPTLPGYGIIQDGAVIIEQGRISWLGKRQDMPMASQSYEHHNLDGQWLTPGLIDCHTHLVFAGQRADEFEPRLNGVSYADIAAQGGGIQRTVNATRQASEEELLKLALRRAGQLLNQGVTCVEIKSGYGLDLITETKMLKVARKVAETLPIGVQTTFLGAHALPTEYKDNADGYIQYLCDTMLPAIAKAQLADAVDGFCESIGFSVEQTRRVFRTARTLDLPVKLHAEQLSNLGASLLAAEYQALSVDHIEYLDEAGVKAIAASGTVATLLPGAFYYLKETQKPPVQLLREHGVPMAIATDFNPGSSPICHLPMMINMACTLFGLTPLEALQGVTINAAKALGQHQRLGSLSIGKQADMVLWDISHPNQLAYQIGDTPINAIWQNGRKIQ